MKAWLCLLLLASPLVFAAPGDDYVLAARDAYRYGERVKLGKQLDALRTLRSQNELEPWVEYWQLRQRLEEQGLEGVGSSPQEFAKIIDEEFALNKKLTAAMKIVPQ